MQQAGGEMGTGDKENHSSEPYGSVLKTPLKQAATSRLVLTEIQPGCQPLTRPPKPKEILPADPWTPTSNLKMLISAASPEIRSREQRRELSNNTSEVLQARHCLQENHSSEPYGSVLKTALKQAATSRLVLTEIQPDCQPLTTPPKPTEILPADPWTPTSNLKMLISAASPEIRSREQRRELSNNTSEVLQARHCLQENHSSEPYGSVLKTALKQAATSRLVLTEIQPGCQPLTTPPKPKEILPADPWTPTSNLKMLISAASPEIRSREQRRELSNNTSEVLQARHCLQENHSSEPYGSVLTTPLKQAATSRLVLTEIQPDCQPLTRPPKPTEILPADPLTPTSNLKMLISAASPEIRSREQRRELSNNTSEVLQARHCLQENHSSEPYGSVLKTPLKQAATSRLVLTEIQPDCQPLTTPPKPKEMLPADPWTPTSNLKMLISAASPEIRSREQRRELSNNTSEVLQARHCLQENHSSEPYGSVLKTPLKQAATSRLVLTEIQPDCQPLTTPPKPTEILPADPWTPTSNLKMLISAARPEIRSREQRRELSNNTSEVLQARHCLQENHSSEPYGSVLKTPLKQAATSRLVLTEIQPDCQPLTTPPKPTEMLPADPWTPTSNLKMLISAASPEIRSREQRRELSNNTSEVLQARHCLQENHSSEPYGSVLKTPLKQAATSRLVLTEIQPDCQPLTRPPKPKEILPADPWTPTSNLKMLISAASPEIRSREQRRELSNNTSEVLQARHCLQENHSSEPYGSVLKTPLKQAATSRLVLTEIQPDCQPLTTPPKPTEILPADPWTPTSNLKMLISAASPEIRSREQRRELSNNTSEVLQARHCLQENHSSEPYGSVLKTPLKQAATSRLVLTEIQPDCQPLTTPPKPTEMLPADPWTPTSNLKMLISAARPEIRSREQRRELSNNTSEVLQARHCLQENHSSEPYGSVLKTPLKQAATSRLVLTEIQPDCQPLTTPPKPTEILPADPWTPTSNLKMQISAASPEIRSREQRRELSNNTSEVLQARHCLQENHSSEPYGSVLKTPLKQAATSRLVLTEIQPGCQPLTRPPKPKEILPADPWTPTSNLKMLISAASPEIRSREQRRELSNNTSEVLQARHCLQENHSSEPYGSVLKTPLKQAATSRLVLTEIQPGCQPLTTPPKPTEILPADPWTPTSNLKMLISAASPEIRSREQRRELSNNTSEVLQARHCLQENHSSEPYGSVLKTPLKQAATSRLVLTEIQPDCQPLTTPPKPTEILPADPWTPTSNLKMLISAASPEIRSREQRRELSNNTSEVLQARHCLQENHSSEPYGSILKTPLKQAATSRLVLTEIQPGCQPLTRPPKPKEILPADPWTPTSNLKMLISAASPEIRSREQRRELSNNTSEVLQARHCLQENHSSEPYGSVLKTPLKQAATSRLVLTEIQPDCQPLTTPPKPTEILPADPWTPTSNLKMLISAASPEIRSREQRRELSNNTSEVLQARHCLQENHSSEPYGSVLKTPLKQAATSRLVLTEIQPGCQPLTTPPKPTEILPADPWTPTSNLKMLISAASPEIRSREQRRELSNNTSEVLQARHCLQEHLSGDEYEKSQPSHKEKSLGLLCCKFLAPYPDYPSTAENIYVGLDEVAEELDVDHRRIYDIVNVLESLHMVSRLAKKRYAWHGRHNLSKTLQALKKVGEENKYTQQIQMIKKREYVHEFDFDGERNEEMARSCGSNEHSEMSFVKLPGKEFRAASVNSRKDKSLRVMSQKFGMLFLVLTPQIVSLEVAAKILIGEDQLEDLDKSKFKTKIKRLYNIANVLSSLELIKKVHVTEGRGRKSAFKWTGPEVLPNIQDTKLETTSTTCPPPISESITSKDQCSKNLFPSRGKQNFTCHPSLIKLVKSIENDRRKVQSALTSPVKISASTDQNLSAFPSKMAQVPAIAKHQLEGQSKKAKEEMKMKLSRSALECNLSSPEVVPKPEPPRTAAPSQQSALTQPLGVCPPSHSSVPPVILPHTHSGVSYAIYLHPSQAHTVTTYSPSFLLQTLPCANVTGIKSISSKVLNKITTEEGDNQIATDDPTKSLAAKDRPTRKSETSSQRCLKRSQALQENNLIKRYRSDEESLDTSLGESIKNERPPPNSSQMKHKMDNFQEEGQNKTKTLDQNVASCYDQCKREDIPEDEDKIKTKQDIPVAFAIPAHETFFPSGYLTPFTQCTHGNKAGFSDQEKAGICSLQHTTYSSPIAGVIPVTTSELKAVNIPAFHITPLNITLSPTSIAAAPVLSNSCLNSSSTSSAQNPSSSVLNFTLQHIGLIPAGVQVPANPVLQHTPVSSQPENVSHSSENMNLQEEKISKNTLQLLDGGGSTGNYSAVIPLQQPCVPEEPQEPPTVTENFFRTPGGPNTVSSLSANSDGTDRMSQGTLYIPQRNLEVSED